MIDVDDEITEKKLVDADRGDDNTTQFANPIQIQKPDSRSHPSPQPRAPRKKRKHPIKVPQGAYADSQSSDQSSDRSSCRQSSAHATNKSPTHSPENQYPGLLGRKKSKHYDKNLSKNKQFTGALNTDTLSNEAPKEILTVSQNKMIEVSAELMALIGFLTTASKPLDVNNLKAEVYQKIKKFRDELTHYYQPLDAERASFALCALLDRSVLKTHWGKEIDWDLYSILMKFHQTAHTETLIHDIHQALDLPQLHLDLLEFYFLCLRMGFEFDSEVNHHLLQGMTPLESALYQRLISAGLDERLPLGILPHDKYIKMKSSEKKFLFWFIPLICIALLSVIFSFLISSLNQADEKILLHFERVASETPSLSIDHFQEQEIVESPSKISIYEALLPLEQAGTIRMYNGERGLRIIVNSDAMFPSGSTRLQGDTRSLAQALGNTLNNYIGTIHVEGHTDNTVFKRAGIGSNQTLSKARASAFSELLFEYLEEPGNVIHSGKAARYPIVCNITQENRAINRRVEILLPDISGVELASYEIYPLPKPKC